MTISASVGGTAVRQLQMGSPSISTSQAWQDPIIQPVGMVIPARAATVIRASPGSAVMVMLSGKKRRVTGVIRKFVTIEGVRCPTVPFCTEKHNRKTQQKSATTPKSGCAVARGNTLEARKEQCFQDWNGEVDGCGGR